MIAWIVFLIVIAMVEGIAILKWWISTAALIYYMEIKKYTQPNREEMAVCTKKVVEFLIKDLFSGK